jgi:hypothetical protein
VTVSSSVIVFTHPAHRGLPFEMRGQEGEVVSVIDGWKGRTVSPTLPVVVAFGKFRAHFRPDELTKL